MCVAATPNALRERRRSECVFVLAMRWLLLYELRGEQVGPIDNAPLLLEPERQVEGLDYVALQPLVWDFLQSRFGGGPDIERSVVLGHRLKPMVDLVRFR